MPHLSVKCYELQGRKTICKFKELTGDISQRDAELPNILPVTKRGLIRTRDTGKGEAPTRKSPRNGRERERQRLGMMEPNRYCARLECLL